MTLLKEGSTYLASVAERELYFKNRDNRNSIVIYVEVKVLQIIEANEHDRYYKVEIRDPEGSTVAHWLPEEVFVPKRWLPGEDARFSRIEIIKELE